jgi:hypothetical protein
MNGLSSFLTSTRARARAFAFLGLLESISNQGRCRLETSDFLERSNATREAEAKQNETDLVRARPRRQSRVLQEVRAREASLDRGLAELSDQYGRGVDFGKVEFSQIAEPERVESRKPSSFPNRIRRFGFPIAWEFLAHYAREGQPTKQNEPALS